MTTREVIAVLAGAIVVGATTSTSLENTAPQTLPARIGCAVDHDYFRCAEYATSGKRAGRRCLRFELLDVWTCTDANGRRRQWVVPQPNDEDAPDGGSRLTAQGD